MSAQEFIKSHVIYNLAYTYKFQLKTTLDHEEERNNEPEFQEMFQVNIINFLRKVCGLEEYEESEIFRIIGIIRTNALQVRINILFKVHIFFEGQNLLRNFHFRFVPRNGQIYGLDFAKFCGHRRIYELYKIIYKGS